MQEFWDFIMQSGIVQFIIGLWSGHKRKVKTNEQLLAQIPEIVETVNQLKAGEVEDLHVELDGLAHTIIKQGYSTDEQFIRLNQIYGVYHSLGGNGLGTKLYEEAKELPTK
ncbi:hypothetical protein [Lactobacillus sp. ESL0681]|uniref:hypothetical protein n=1 Tax=Lactobacillus sp. ESL0681 TaxID=2983211 RepID=UPI0023F8F55C|nr:hypothetical protein [Lactobacillus sp. ESL0681]WEV40373.1 hypothetical protein OZX59_00200 [Lactobacillus sp. ESL0681]